MNLLIHFFIACIIQIPLVLCLLCDPWRDMSHMGLEKRKYRKEEKTTRKKVITISLPCFHTEEKYIEQQQHQELQQKGNPSVLIDIVTATKKKKKNAYRCYQRGAHSQPFGYLFYL